MSQGTKNNVVIDDVIDNVIDNVVIDVVIDEVIDEVIQVEGGTPFFTARDTCIGLAACLGVGLLVSLTLSAIILLLSANAQAQEFAGPAYPEQNVLNIIDFSTPESVISQKCDSRIGQLKNLNIGDQLTFQNEGNIQHNFRITGIQVVEKQPVFLPVVDHASMLTMITCYPADIEKSELAVSYLVMIQEIESNQEQNVNFENLHASNYNQAFMHISLD